VLGVTLRATTAVLLILVMGVPLVGALCVRECDTPRVAAVEGDSHCHEPVAADTTRIAPLAPEPCNPFLTTVVATLERAGTSMGSAPTAPAYLQVPLTASGLDTLPRAVTNRPLAIVGLRFGTHLPLRI
jgi:hypothetical protein